MESFCQDPNLKTNLKNQQLARENGIHRSFCYSAMYNLPIHATIGDHASGDYRFPKHHFELLDNCLTAL